ncbi:hypothetical protein ACJX0J_012148, partial [Zea mays]
TTTTVRTTQEGMSNMLYESFLHEIETIEMTCLKKVEKKLYQILQVDLNHIERRKIKRTCAYIVVMQNMNNIRMKQETKKNYIYDSKTQKNNEQKEMQVRLN